MSSYGYSIDEGEESKSAKSSPPPPQQAAAAGLYGDNYSNALTVATSTPIHNTLNAAPQTTPARQIMMMMKRNDLDAPMYSYTSTGAINWKALWNALLSGQHASLRKWVVDLPIKGCKVDGNGQLDVGASALPPTFALQLDEMLEKAVPPLADLVIDALCWRGLFLPSELANFDLLSIRLARNHLLLRPAGRRENKPLSLEKFLPFGSLSSFHRYMLTKRLRHNVYQHQTLRKTYITWYKLKPFVAELDASQLVLKTGTGKPSRPMLDVSGKGVVNPLVGTFQQGFGYILGFATDGTPEFGSEEEGIEALRVAQELADAEMKLKIDAEIEEIQLLAAEALVQPNFNYKWLKLLGVPALKVHPIHIHHDRVSALLNDEIDAMMPAKGRAGDLLSNSPSDQILMLILFLVYKNSSVRAVRISMPLLSSNPGVMYRYLSTLVCKVAISSCTVLSRSNKRNQANCLHYLKMVQQYVDSLPGNSNDGRTTIHGLPSSQNYALFASMILDFAAILQRYLSMSDIVNNPSLSSMLPHNSPHLSHFEKLHLPSLMWLVFDALMKRRATRLQNESNQVGEGSIIMQMETETDDDTRIIQWFLALGLRLYKTIVAAKRSGGQNAVKVNTDSSTMLYLLFGFHMLFHEMFPQGFGELLRQEQCGAGPVALFCKTFLFFGGVSQESPMLLVRRILQLHDENFFEGELAGYSTSSTSDGRSGEEIAKEPLSGVTCLEHLCLVLAPYSAILLASKIPEPLEQGVVLTNRQKQERAASVKPIWDPTSESLLRIAFDPFTQNVLPLSNPAKASYLLSKSGGDEAIMALACGIGASAADCMLAWMRRNQTEILNGVPELPVPGPKPPLFAERSLPLEKSLLRLVRAGCWYTLCNGFKLFAPHNVLYSVVQFLKYFTQRRYQLCQQALEATFEGMSVTRSLKQPMFGRKHFFAVVGSGNNAASSRDINDRNAQSYLWTQRMLIQILRSGLLIGMQGNIPSSHRMANARDMKLAGASNANPGGYTSIDLTDYDRNFLMDLFSGVLNKYGKNPDVPDMAAFQDAEPVFTMQMMNEILSVIPPTVSSSFLLNITSIHANGAAKKSAIQKYKEHKYNVWKSRLQAWREHETYYSKKINEVTSLLDLEQMSGVSIEERTRFIRFVYKEMDELELNEALQAALWYQISQYFYRNPHTIPDSLVAKVSNSSAEAAHLTLNAGGTIASSSQVAINLAAVSNPHLQDPEYFNRQANFEHTSERAECEQEILLLYLAMVNWKICLDNVSQELDDYWARYPHLRPVPKVVSTNLDGTKVYSKTELSAATDREGKPLPLPGEITNKLNLKSQYDYVVNRMIGRIHWLMVLHGMNNLRDTKISWITFDLNDATSVKDFNLRQKEREELNMKQHTAKLVKEAEKDAQMFADRSARRRTGGDDEPDELPETNHESDDDHDDDDEEDDVLYPPLTITFESIYEAHMVASGRVAGSGGNIAGLSYGLEKFHILGPSQYLPWNGSDAQTPNSAVQDAAAKHRAIAFAFDEDMDLTRLSPAEVRLLGENSVDTRFVLALIENLIHSKRFRLALCVISDVLERFPSLRYTPRMQAAVSLCDMLQFLFWLAHPTLQDIAINKVLSGATGAPFVGQRTSLVLPEDEDPYACCYKEVLDWPVVKHILREEDQTWMRMRWYAGNGMSNQTLMLQRLLVDSPSGSLYQNVLLSLLLADESSGVATVYSRTRPVGVDIKPASETSTETTEEKSGIVGSIFGTMKTLGNAFKTSAQAAASAAGASSSGPSDPSAIDVEHMRQWLLTLDEAARVELLDRFVQLANNPAGASVTATPQAPSGLSATGVGPHTLVKESFNQHYGALAMRHLPLLCEIAQFLAIAVRVTKVELTKPRNKKLQVVEQPGVRMSSQNFLVALTTVLTKTRPLSVRLPSTIPLHYASKSRLLPDTNSPTHAFMLNMAENLGVGVLQLLNLHPAEILATLWKAPGAAERAGISTLLQSGQCYYHFMNHRDFHQQEGEVGPSDLSAAFVQTFMDEQKIVDEGAGPPSPFSNFQQGAWWTREDYIAFVGSADRSASLSLATLGAAFRAQALVIIRERDPTALVSSSLLAANETASALIQDWSKARDESRPMVHEQNAGEFVRLQPGSMLEFELLHASYICYLSAGRTFEMRQVAADLRAGLQQLLSSVLTKSKTPAPPIIVSPTNPNETIAPPFPGASVQQVEQVFLARLQLERCAKFLNNGEMRDVIVNMWRQFKKKAPATFA